MAMNKNGMLDTGFNKGGSTHKSSKKTYDISAMIQYCKSKGIKIEDLTPEELCRFEN